MGPLVFIKIFAKLIGRPKPARKFPINIHRKDKTVEYNSRLIYCQTQKYQAFIRMNGTCSISDRANVTYINLRVYSNGSIENHHYNTAYTIHPNGLYSHVRLYEQ